MWVRIDLISGLLVFLIRYSSADMDNKKESSAEMPTMDSSSTNLSVGQSMSTSLVSTPSANSSPINTSSDQPMSSSPVSSPPPPISTSSSPIVSSTVGSSANFSTTPAGLLPTTVLSGNTSAATGTPSSNGSTTAGASSGQSSITTPPMANGSITTPPMVNVSATATTVSGSPLLNQTGSSTQGLAVQGSTSSTTVEDKSSSEVDGPLDPAIEQEYTSAESGTDLGDSFNGQTLQKCGGKPHPVLVLNKMLKKKGIDKEFKDNICKANYHLHCSTDPSWSKCTINGAIKFCPGTCNVSDCSALKKHGNDDSSKPTYKSQAECIDSTTVNCSHLYDRGDCFAMPRPLTSLCPQTCGFCEKFKNFAPFMPDQERLFWWLVGYQHGKHRKYGRLLAEKETQLKAKITQGTC